MLFNPSVSEVRQFFIAAWSKYQQKHVLTPLESIVAAIIERHPEYHAWLADESAVDRKAMPGMQPPFLHLSLHLALEEQIAIDHPPGIRACWERLCKTNEEHEAYHKMMVCLGDIIEQAQRNGAWPDTETYLDLLKRVE
ncbi:MAG: DUF1841 family protein [Pseudomonadota bacterium]